MDGEQVVPPGGDAQLDSLEFGPDEIVLGMTEIILERGWGTIGYVKGGDVLLTRRAVRCVCHHQLKGHLISLTYA